MASAVLLARYLLDEASSGTGPTTVADDGGGGHDLTIDYGTSDANWTSDTEGNGLDFLDTAGTAIADIADMSGAGSIGDALDGAKECSLIIVARVDGGVSGGSRLVHLGSDSGNGEIGVVIAATGQWLYARFGRESGGGDNRYAWGDLSPALVGSSKRVIHVVFNSAESVQSDRAKLYIDGVHQTTINNSNIPLNETLSTNGVGDSFCIGNRPVGNAEIDGAAFYCEIYSGLLTASQISDSYNALILDHDSDWAAAASEDGEVIRLGTNF